MQVMSHALRSQDGRSLEGVRIALVGKLSGMARREVQQLIQDHGGIVLDRPDATATLLVVGDERAADKPLRSAVWRLPMADALAAAVERGEVEVLSETDLWRRLGLVDVER